MNGPGGFVMSFGVRMFKTVLFLALVLLRELMDRLPREDCRKIEDLEKNLSVMADDGEKLLLPGQVAMMGMMGWILILVLGVMPICEIIEIVLGW